MDSASSGFSGIVQVADVDDFLAPSQECVKPFVVNKPKKRTDQRSAVSIEECAPTSGSEQQPVVGLVDRKKRRSGGTVQKSEEIKKKVPVTISLNDCLACSGCVTSAETVLIQEQSPQELISVLADKKKFVVITISPQSKASLGARYDLSLEEVELRLVRGLRLQGVDMILDSTLGRSFSLLAAQQEFLKRLQQSRPSGKREKLPVFASACPGWICYAEKSQGTWVLPYISAVRSPQAVMGALVKDYLSKLKGVLPSDIYHVSVMPCFDKKLEASRNDFLVPGTKVREVDCVISTGEFDLFLTECGVSLSDTVSLSCFEEDEVSKLLRVRSSHAGSASGGYAHHVLGYAGSQLFGLSRMETEQLKCSVLKNKDLSEISLVKDDETLMVAAVANGFRNIQNLMQKLKRNKCSYDYVEIMACPSGCLNGGGQIRSSSNREQRTDLAKVTELYSSNQTEYPEENTNVQRILTEWLGGINSAKARQMLFTHYHTIEQDFLTSSIVKW